MPVPSETHRRAPAVLLVEFAAVGRFILGIELPFIHALLRHRLQLPVQWVRFALDPAVQYRTGESGIALDAEDLERLCREVAPLDPTHVLFSHAPARSLWEALRARAPRASARFLSDESSDEADPRADRAEASGPPAPLAHEALAVLRWLGVTSAIDLDSVEPDFGFVAGNRAAREMPPLGFIAAGADCLYRASVVGNPAYAGVDLTDCRTEGCTFCTSGARPPAREGPAAARAVRQIAAFFRTYPFPSPEARARLRLPGHQALLEVAELADGLRALDRRGADLLLDGRSDHLLKRRAELERTAEILTGTGHKVHICLVGVENFSARELERMNKGVKPWQNLAAIRMLRELEHRYPATFGFSEHGGLSTIIFTPWTTLEDLALNLAVARHGRLERLCGKFLTSRARLYPGLPMTALARQDGLLVDAYDDPALDTARRNFYPDEIPWRFAHPEVEAVNRITTRMEPNPALEADPLYDAVQSWLGPEATDGAARFARAAALVARAMATTRPLTAEELLAAASPRRPRSASPAPAAGEETADLPRMLVLQGAGLCRVSRLEGLSREAAEQAERRVQAEGAAALVTRRRTDAEDTWEVFFGRDRSEVLEAARLTDVIYGYASPADLAAAKERVGELLGYPACCGRSFAAVHSPAPTVNEWLLVKRRCDEPGAVSPFLNPFGLVNYVPCSCTCVASLTRAHAVLEVLRRSVGEERAARTAAELEYPVLFLLDRPGQYAKLVPAGGVGRRFDFAAGLRTGDDPRLGALDGGGTISMADGAILVERDGRRIASFFLTAALWWHEAALDAEFWRSCAQQVLERVPGAPAAAPNTGHPPEPSAATEALAGRLTARFLPHGRLAGFTVRSIEPSLGRHVVVTLVRPGGEMLIVHVEPLAGARRYYRAVGDLAVSYSDHTPLDTATRRAALRALTGRLSHAP